MLHDSVVVAEWDHKWLGVRKATNNTAELTNLGGFMLWLLDEAPGNGGEPVVVRFDSIYVANMARGLPGPMKNSLSAS